MHLPLLEKERNREALIVGLEYLAAFSRIGDTEVFKVGARVRAWVGVCGALALASAHASFGFAYEHTRECISPLQVCLEYWNQLGNELYSSECRALGPAPGALIGAVAAARAVLQMHSRIIEFCNSVQLRARRVRSRADRGEWRRSGRRGSAPPLVSARTVDGCVRRLLLLRGEGAAGGVSARDRSTRARMSYVFAYAVKCTSE